MKTALSIAVIFTTALFINDAFAQLPVQQGHLKQFNSLVSFSPLESPRLQGGPANAHMRGGTSVSMYLDYSNSSGDDTYNMWNTNLRYALPADSFTQRYSVVAFDSLHDFFTDNGYNYSDFDSIIVDTIYFAFGHQNTSGTNDTLIVKIIQLNAFGYPAATAPVLWADTFISNTSLTGQASWTDPIFASLAPGLKLNSGQRFGIRLDYSGAKQDTFGYLYSFRDKGPCPAFNLPVSPFYSDFYPNSFRFDVNNSTQLPTPTGLDYALDCDNDGTNETAFFIQNILYSADITAYFGSGPQPGCDTISNVDNLAPGDFAVYLDPSGGAGYLAGHNSFGDQSKADIFANTVPNLEVTGALYVFGVADFASPTSSITAHVWNSSGPGGSPGAIVASQTVTISSIAQDITNGLPTFVQFNPPAVVSGNFYVGINYAYAAGDTVALVTSVVGSNTPTGWEQWSQADGGGWYAYANPQSWGFDIAHAIFPIVCISGTPCPEISVTTTITAPICSSSNGSATASATDGNAPYSYAWSNGQSTATATGLAAGTYYVTATDNDGCEGIDTVTITVNIITLSVTVNTTDNTSCSAPNGTADATVTGGTGPYSYTWSNGASTESVSGLAANTYGVTIYDANGCSGTGSGVVSDNLPVITVNGTATDNTQCLNPNGSATASANGGNGPYTYLWDAAAGNQTTATATDLAGGNYSVTATDADGCTGTGSVTVGSTTPVITISVDASSPNNSCAAPDGSATVSAAGGTAPYTFAWDNGQTGPDLINVGGGDYDVTATDANGCTGTLTVVISSNTPVINVVVTTTDNTNCVNTNGTATAAASGGSGTFTSYQWTGGLSGMMISDLATGIYTVTVTDDNSCTGVGSGSVGDNRPLFTVSTTSSPVTNCLTPNGSASATVNPSSLNVTYAWSTSPIQTGPNATNLSAGTYQVTATESSSGCTATASAVIGTNTPAVNVNIASSNNVTNCASPNGSATAVASGGVGGFTYQWLTSPTQTGPTATNLNTGSYTVVATDANGCTGTNSVTIGDDRANVSVAVGVNSDVTSCTNPNGSVTAVPSPSGATYTYLWNNQSTSASLNNLQVGTYSVTVTDNNGCSATGSATVGSDITLPTLTVNVTDETSNGANDGTASATATGDATPFTYAWSNSATTEEITGLTAGIYSVTVTDQAGCTATATVTVNTEVGIGDLKEVSRIALFPNPANDFVNLVLELTEVKDVTVKLYNVLGETVMEMPRVKTQMLNEKFDLTTLPQGVYMVRIRVGDGEMTRRVTLVK